MLRHKNRQNRERERILADAMQNLASELRLVEPAEYIAFLRTEQFANLSTLVNSSTELYFLPGAVSFGQSGDIEVSWGQTPVVHLDMEFKHKDVKAYFRLMLDSQEAGIEVTFMEFSTPRLSAAGKIRALKAALSDAQLATRVELAAPVAAT